MRIGVDLGGTNLRVAAFGDDPARPLAELREPVGEPRDPDAIVDRVARAIEDISGGAEATVGVGIAAMLRDRVGTVASSPHLRWRDVPFGRLLARRLGAGHAGNGTRHRLGVYNDASAIVWGESVAGAARGCRDVLGVYVGTGIGAGVIANGALVEGTSACAGEIGHVKVRWDDAAAPCACGQLGCVEAYVGGAYVQRRILEELARGARSSALALAGGLAHVHAGHVDAAAGEGDAWALALWTELAPLLAVALAGALAVLNPERLVLGGGLLARCPTLYQLVVTALEVAAPAASLEPLSIALAELGDVAGPCGAAHLAASGVSIVS
ncbi:MAG TPA: ROK family protein [Kofleriaceae bacterium]|nr:ROK family protein [Kofleriaceae bacterium]